MQYWRLEILTWAMSIWACMCVDRVTAGHGIRTFQITETGEKMLVCYYSRSTRLPASQVPSDLCTHIIYAFGVISPEGIKPTSSADINTYRALISLKDRNPSLKVLISLQNDFSSVVDKGSTAASSFSSKAVAFLQKYKFDGVDLDWEYPTSSQKDAFSKFIQILSSSLHSSGYLLSMALPNSHARFRSGFDSSTINRYVDFMTAMTYDFHMYIKEKDTTTGYNSPLQAPAGESKYYSSQGMMEFYISQGISKSKLLLGIPTYGRSWTLADSKRYGLHSPAVGKGAPAPRTGLKGLYTYPDVCVAKQQGAITVRDDKSKAEYLHQGTAWVSYENDFTVRAKVAWVKAQRLAGVGVWALQIDDAQGVCKLGPLPLVNTIRSLLAENFVTAN